MCVYIIYIFFFFLFESLEVLLQLSSSEFRMQEVYLGLTPVGEKGWKEDQVEKEVKPWSRPGQTLVNLVGTSEVSLPCQGLGPKWLGFWAPAWLSHRMQTGPVRVNCGEVALCNPSQSCGSGLLEAAPWAHFLWPRGKLRPCISERCDVQFYDALFTPSSLSNRMNINFGSFLIILLYSFLSPQY